MPGQSTLAFTNPVLKRKLDMGGIDFTNPVLKRMAREDLCLSETAPYEVLFT